MSATYRSESGFIVTHDGRMVYSLRQCGFKKGEPLMVNDVTVVIEAHHLSPEVRMKIARAIQLTLNDNHGP